MFFQTLDVFKAGVSHSLPLHLRSSLLVLAPAKLEIYFDFLPVPGSCPYKAAVSLWLYIHDLVPSVAVGTYQQSVQ